MFTEEQADKLRVVLEDGFRKGKSIKEMAIDVTKEVKPKDLVKMENGKIVLGAAGLAILVTGKKARSVGIVRTEVTNLANKGAEEHYKSKGVKKVRWVASYGARTCPECEALDGQIFNIGGGPRPALHPLCRCTMVAVSEVI